VIELFNFWPKKSKNEMRPGDYKWE